MSRQLAVDSVLEQSVAAAKSDDQRTAMQALLWAATGAGSEAEYLDECLRHLREVLSADFLALAARDGQGWNVLHRQGQRQPLPVQLLNEAADSEQAQSLGSWVACPLANPTETQLLVAHLPNGGMNTACELLGAAAPLIVRGLRCVGERARQQRRVRRLEALLEISSRWNRTQEMDPLLQEIARTATQLLQADRASIFLWERASHSLVGRPALGVEGEPLRIPDHAGLVGQVVHSGRARRLDAQGDLKQVNREVDARLGYETRTLLCVPLRGRDGAVLGAFETINKLDGNFNEEDEYALTELAALASIALENTQERHSLLESRRQISEQAAQQVQMIGDSPAIVALRSTVQRVANTDLAVLILGENGAGKEIIAQLTHYQSARRDQPFIAVNCAAIPDTLLESELFGHEKGAFTDAVRTRPGKFEMASGGTLFLDEIGDLSLSGQAKLLRVLEEKIVVRVGGSTPIATDARVIAATNQNLAEMVRQKRFREDLFFRLNVVSLKLPPLRERGDDVLLLAQHFLEEFSRKARRKPPKLSTATRNRLLRHAWPGNVRELRNLMERLAYLTTGDQIEPEDLDFILPTPSAGAATLPGQSTLADATGEFQTEFIQQAIRRARGNMSEAARLLGLHRSNLYRKMQQLGMPVNETE